MINEITQYIINDEYDKIDDLIEMYDGKEYLFLKKFDKEKLNDKKCIILTPEELNMDMELHNLYNDIIHFKNKRPDGIRSVDIIQIPIIFISLAYEKEIKNEILFEYCEYIQYNISELNNDKYNKILARFLYYCSENSVINYMNKDFLENLKILYRSGYDFFKSENVIARIFLYLLDDLEYLDILIKTINYIEPSYVSSYHIDNFIKDDIENISNTDDYNTENLLVLYKLLIEKGFEIYENSSDYFLNALLENNIDVIKFFIDIKYPLLDKIEKEHYLKLIDTDDDYPLPLIEKSTLILLSNNDNFSNFIKDNILELRFVTTNECFKYIMSFN